MRTPKLLDQVRIVARVRHYSPRTERAYVGWIRRFILFHNKKHPIDMAEPEIRQFKNRVDDGKWNKQRRSYLNRTQQTVPVDHHAL